MELSMMSTMAAPEAMPAAMKPAAHHERAEHFAQLLQAEPLRANVYVDPPASSLDSRNPVVAAASHFESMDFASGALRRAEALASGPAPGGAGSELSDFGREAVFAQAEMLRTVLMMEVTNSAKQGITTLFQQQG